MEIGLVSYALYMDNKSWNESLDMSDSEQKRLYGDYAEYREQHPLVVKRNLDEITEVELNGNRREYGLMLRAFYQNLKKNLEKNTEDTDHIKGLLQDLAGQAAGQIQRLGGFGAFVDAFGGAAELEEESLYLQKFSGVPEKEVKENFSNFDKSEKYWRQQRLNTWMDECRELLLKAGVAEGEDIDRKTLNLMNAQLEGSSEPVGIFQSFSLREQKWMHWRISFLLNLQEKEEEKKRDLEGICSEAEIVKRTDHFLEKLLGNLMFTKKRRA